MRDFRGKGKGERRERGRGRDSGRKAKELVAAWGRLVFYRLVLVTGGVGVGFGSLGGFGEGVVVAGWYGGDFDEIRAWDLFFLEMRVT